MTSSLLGREVLWVLPNVRADELGFGTVVMQLSGKISARMVAAAGHDDAGAILGISQCCGTGDPGQSAGDENNEMIHPMDLRHMRYFVAVAEVGSLHVAAERRLHTAQPSLSRQMRDLEAELGCRLMHRSARGVELTAAGRVFLDHARVILLQVEAAREAARRAAEPPRTAFVLGFLTGFEFDWLAGVMAILREEIPEAEITVLSRSSPDLGRARAAIRVGQFLNGDLARRIDARRRADAALRA